jgi:peptide/nickel transport system permease protein
MIIIGAGLSFLGLGVATPTPEWGLMLNDLRTAMFINPIVAATPGVFIFLTSLAFSNLGHALERRWSLARR